MNAKKIIGIGIGIAATCYGAYKLLSGKDPQKYSSKWFDTVSDEVLNAEREVMRKQYCSAGDDFSLAGSLQNLLNRFDSVLRKRACGGETPNGPRYYRERNKSLIGGVHIGIPRIVQAS